MTQLTDYQIMLQMIADPAFLVANNIITASNQSALSEGFTPGLSVRELFVNATQDLDHSCISTVIQLNNEQWNTVILPLDNMYVFRLAREGCSPALKSLYLMNTELRYPVGNISLLMTQLISNNGQKALNARANQEFQKILRVLNNVSNASRYSEDRTQFQQEYNICAVLSELLEECSALLAHAGIHLHSTLPAEPVYTMLDRAMFRQAVYNLVDNAAKFSPPGGTVEVSLTHRNNNLQLSVEDEGPGIPQEILCNLFTRFTRDATEPDSRSGLGIGLTIVRSAAAAHGGTVLVDTSPAGGARVTMTMSIRQSKHFKLHSQIDRVIPSPDHGLIMLSNVLPTELYATPEE